MTTSDNNQDQQPSSETTADKPKINLQEAIRQKLANKKQQQNKTKSPDHGGNSYKGIQNQSSKKSNPLFRRKST